MHSWYIAMLCEQGIIGLALYLAFFMAVYKNIKPAIKENDNKDNMSRYLLALVIGLAAAGLFSSGPFRKILFVMAGISVVFNRINKDTIDGHETREEN